MKNIKYIILTLISFGIVSCNLDQSPESEAERDKDITDAVKVNNLVVGCYNALHKPLYYEWSVTEVRTDNTRLHSANSVSTTSRVIRELDYNRVGSDNQFMAGYWDGTYVVINRCNDVVSFIDMVEDPILKAQYEGEARFLRAHSYFNLVRLWGGVFLVTKALSKEEARVKQRSSTKEIYDFIEKELNDIIDNSMLPMSYPGKDIGRATLTAAKALLAKVYVTRYDMEDAQYTKAKELLEAVLAEVGDPHTAADLVIYEDIFNTKKEMNKEIIFAVRYSAVGKDIGSPFGNLFAPTNNGGGVIIGTSSSFNFPTDNIITAFKQSPLDVREDISLQKSYVKPNGEVIASSTSRFVNKYRRPILLDLDGESDWPIIRVGDMTLLYAEVLNEIEGPSTKAIQYLNMTRERAGLPAYTSADLGNRVTFMEALKAERRLELVFENHRFFDLVRWGDAVEVISNLYKTETFYADQSSIAVWQTKLPLPLSIFNINSDIPQNIGY